MLVAPLTTSCSTGQPSVQLHSKLRCPAASLNRGAQLVTTGPRSRCGSRWQHNINSSILQTPPSPNTAHRIAVGRSPGPTCVTAPAVALDVEYAHYRTAEGRHVSFPAWVAVVDEHCNVLLKAHISQQVTAGTRWIGGVPVADCAEAPSLPAILQQLQDLVADQLLLGHGLAKDLAALGFDHPQALRFDTMTHPAFCNKAGNARTLKQLARQFLSQDIQQGQRLEQQGQGLGAAQPEAALQGTHEHATQDDQTLAEQHQHDAPGIRTRPRLSSVSSQVPSLQAQSAQQGALAGNTRQQLQQQNQRPQARVAGGRHDPQEDAAAVMQLYQQVVFPSTYEGQVAAATAQLLASMKAHRGHAEEA